MDDMIKPLREDFVLMQPHILLGSRFPPAVAPVFPDVSVPAPMEDAHDASLPHLP